MQAGGAVQGAGTVLHSRRRLNALIAIAAILMITALVALAVWVTPLVTTSGVGTEDAIPKAGAGSAIVHDDAGSMLPEAGAVPAVVHDDAGDIPSGTGTTRVPGSGLD